MEVENRREKLFIIDMLKGGDADNKPEKVTVTTNQSNLFMILFIISHNMMMMIPILQKKVGGGMPDDVRDMLGLPTQKETERQRRSRSEPRSPRGSAKSVRTSNFLIRCDNLGTGQTEDPADSETQKGFEQLPARPEAAPVTVREIRSAGQEKSTQCFPG